MRVNLKSIEFDKYERVFAFGCSFTEYMWPTWANVLSYEMPNAEFYNWGKCGGGNVFIASMVMAINQKYKYTERDLVMIMWSTHSREDRYIKSSWLTPGNIFSQNYYSDDFIKQFTCLKGYLVRDLAYMASTKYALKALPCDSLMLQSVRPDYDKIQNLKFFDKDELAGISEVVELYKDIIDDFPPTLHSYMNDGHGGFVNGHHYVWPGLDYKGDKFSDYHPNPKMYMNYLKHIGINISDKTTEYVNKINDELLKIETRPLIEEWSTNLYKSNPKYHVGLHLV
jgi:hypothetical protein